MADLIPDRGVQDDQEEDFGLDSSVVSSVRLATISGNAAALVDLLEPMHPADVADLLEQIDPGLRREVLRLGSRAFDGEFLSELDESLRDEVIEFLPDDVVSEAVRELETDDVVDLVEDLDEPQQEVVLAALEDADRVAVEQALAYPDESAGRLMQREFVTAPEHWTVGQAIDFLRASEELPEQFYHVIIVDPRLRPTGYVTLGKLLASARSVALTDITEDTFRSIRVTQPEEDVAYAFNQYHLISAPVVDEDDRLIGVITIDDAMAVLDEEHEEDILRLAGVGETSMSDRVIETTKARFPWLFVNLITAILASMVIARYEATIAEFVALAILMPIVASMGGNAGTQALTVAVRALATKDLTRANLWRVIKRETLVGLANGIVFALLLGMVGYVWFGSAALGWVLAAAMLVNLVIAGLAGILVPVSLEKLGIDPALASGAFVTTVTDVVGFFAFLGLAGAIMF